MSPLHVIAKHAPAFHAATAGMPYVRRGVWWSELLSFYACAKEAGATYVVESGTGLGHSASVLARLFPEVITIGLEPAPHLPANVTAVTGDAWEVLLDVRMPDAAFLIDGPKHQEAVRLARHVVEHHKPKALAIHDLQHGSPGREYAAMMFPAMWFTDSPDYVAAYGNMDADCIHMASSRGKTFTTHGPTLGIVTL